MLLNLENKVNIFRVYRQGFEPAVLQFFMAVSICGLGEHFKAATTGEWLFSGVWSQMVVHGCLLPEALVAHLANEGLLEPIRLLASPPENFEPWRGLLHLLNFFRFLFNRWSMLTLMSDDLLFNTDFLRLLPLLSEVLNRPCLSFNILVGSWQIKGAEDRSDFLLPVCHFVFR